MKIGQVSPVPSAAPFLQESPLKLHDIWEYWKNLAPAGDGEQRDVAVRRMEACLENPALPLDLRELALSALPHFLPPTSRLTVSENLLEGLLSHKQLHRSAESVISDYVDNVLIYYFDTFFLRELNVDNSHFLGTLFSAGADQIDKLVARVALEFIAERENIQANVRDGLSKYIHHIFVAGQSFDFADLRHELAILLHGEYCETAYRCAR